MPTRKILAALSSIIFAALLPGQTPALEATDAQLDGLEALYRHFHQNPELSFRETATAARLADELQKAGCEVTRNVGGQGLVGVLKNGDGPVLLLRADMDALPVAEETGLPYASKIRAEGEGGRAIGVMHACGHDVHMTCLVGAVQVLAQHREAWRGTLVCIGQPAEERAGGARAMLKAGLLERFPKPAFAVALHTSADLPTGQVGVRSGPTCANVDSCDITMLGRGGHGSTPHLAIDPIVQAASLVMELQTIVSREIDALDPAVVTVGAIEGGNKHNIIPDRCHLQVTLRSYSPKVREQLKKAVERKAKAVAQAHRAPEPLVEFSEPASALLNDPGLTARAAAAMRRALGEGNVVEVPPVMGAEDFGEFGQAGLPVCMFRLGTIAPERLQKLVAEGNVPPLHSGRYWPDVRPSLRTGIRCLAAVAQELLPAK
jgi:hippurate hydrolase